LWRRGWGGVDVRFMRERFAERLVHSRVSRTSLGKFALEAAASSLNIAVFLVHETLCQDAGCGFGVSGVSRNTGETKQPTYSACTALSILPTLTPDSKHLVPQSVLMSSYNTLISKQNKLRDPCKIWGFHGGDYEERCLPGCYAVWLL
jgi:hypothetical protein